MFGEDRERIVEAESSPEQKGGRGKAFQRVYAAVIILAAVAFVALALLVRDEEILKIDIHTLVTIRPPGGSRPPTP